MQKWIKTEILFENFDSEAAQGHAKVLDQSIGLLHPMSHCYDHGKFDKFRVYGHFVPSHFSSSVGHLVSSISHFVPKKSHFIPKIRSQ